MSAPAPGTPTPIIDERCSRAIIKFLGGQAIRRAPSAIVSSLNYSSKILRLLLLTGFSLFACDGADEPTATGSGDDNTLNSAGSGAGSASGGSHTGGSSVGTGGAGSTTSTGGTSSGGGTPSGSGGEEKLSTGGTESGSGGATVGSGGAVDGGGGAIKGSGGSAQGTGGTDGEAALLSRDSAVRIMPFGDSITEASPWRAKLVAKLDEGDFDVEFVGSVGGVHEGHGGYLATESRTQDGLLGENGWAMQNPADVVLFMWGTNDVWNSPTIPTILDAYSTLIGGLRAANPEVIVLVAQITPMSPDESTCGGCTCANCLSRVEELNSAIPSWAEGLSTDPSPIIVVDHYSGFDVDADTSDKVHPNDSGAEKQAQTWFEAIVSLY